MNSTVQWILQSPIIMMVLLSPLLYFLEWKFPFSNYKNPAQLKQSLQDIFWYVFEVLISPRLFLVFNFINFFIIAQFWSNLFPFLSDLFWKNIFPLLARFGFSIAQIQTFGLQRIEFKSELISFIVIFLLWDLLRYAVHRWLHSTALWPIHMLHHSSESINWLSSARAYWLDSATYSFLTLWLFMFIKVSNETIFILGLIELFFDLFVHANIKLPISPLTKVINTPTIHHWHHSKENIFPHGQNFGNALAIWDYWFGTFYLDPNNQPPKKYGLSEVDEYPDSILKRLVFPFSKLYHFLKKRFGSRDPETQR